MATLLLPGTMAKVLSFLQSIYASRSVAFFNFAYFQPDFIKVQAHYLDCMAMEPRTGILTLWSLHWCLSLITTDKVEEIWNQPMFSHFSNMILKVGRKHEPRLRTHAHCDQFVEHKLQLPTYATSLSLPIEAGCPSGFRHTWLDPGHLGTHLPYTRHMPPSPWLPSSLTFILSLPRNQWPHICTLRGNHADWPQPSPPGSSSQKASFNIYVVHMHAKSLCGLLPARLLCPWDSPNKNTGVGCMPSSRGSSQPRDQSWVSWVSCVSCIGRWVLYH